MPLMSFGSPMLALFMKAHIRIRVSFKNGELKSEFHGPKRVVE